MVLRLEIEKHWLLSKNAQEGYENTLELNAILDVNERSGHLLILSGKVCWISPSMWATQLLYLFEECKLDPLLFLLPMKLPTSSF